ncbi:MAG TPA: HlyD family secretion protein [Polyangiaceae bacterium]|jgi:membrane fusion protein (multidrug efflux system)|nr:HlyD family secretion protein [Polyangiaceae bacterium]
MTATTASLPADATEAPERPSTSARLDKDLRARARPLLVLAALAAVGGAYWLHARGFEKTDDAQVDGDITSLAPKIASNVVQVYFAENQVVHRGDVLAELDRRELETGLEAARAELARVRAELATADPSVHMTQTSNVAELASASSEISSSRAAIAAALRRVDRNTAELGRAEAAQKFAATELERAQRLYDQQVTALADLQAHQNAAAAAAAALEALKQELAEARELSARESAQAEAARARLQELSSNAPRRLEVRKATVEAKHAAVQLAQAAVEQAELQLSFTKITAPVDGTIAHKAVTVGDHVVPGQQLFAITQLSALWVTANLRETQLARVRPGQEVEVYVDALDASLGGTVDSIGGATGARLSLFPPENAAGNFVKVVQRIPVRIRLRPGQPGLERLRPGMSVVPTIRL